MKHITDQNWFAVGLDVIVVIVGIFLGMQVSEWNEDLKAKSEERQILLQLKEEFTEIKGSLEKQIAVRIMWSQHMYLLVAAIEGSNSDVTMEDIKAGLEAAANPGRQAPQSTTFLQLMSNDGLSTLSNAKLRTALMRYDSRFKRDSFIHEKLIDFTILEFSDNSFVDRDFLSISQTGAKIDQDLTNSENAGSTIRSYNFEGVKKMEAHYEAIFQLHSLQKTAEEKQLAYTEEVLKLISK
jgi:hypothetical protein